MSALDDEKRRIAREMYEAGASTTRIADLLGTSYQTVCKVLKRAGVEMRRSNRTFDYGVMTGLYLSGKTLQEVASITGSSLGNVSRALKAQGTTIRSAPKGPANKLWKGGSRDRDGYVIVSGRVRLHRQLVECHLGRQLEHWEHVHHVDGDKTNQGIRNLVVIPTREHTRFHCFLRSRGLPISRDSLERFCRVDGDIYRFTLADALRQQYMPRKQAERRARSICIEVDCSDAAYGHGLCGKHYQRKKAAERGFWRSGSGRISVYRGGGSFRAYNPNIEQDAARALADPAARDGLVAGAKAKRLFE